jgi:steroid delta-isomerase-like uncharacterized protein
MLHFVKLLTEIPRRSSREHIMSVEHNKHLSRRWFEEVWNQRRIETIDELLAPDAIAHGLDPSDARPGPAVFVDFWKRFCGAFPELHIHVEEVIGEADVTVTRITFRGMHGGPHLGAPPTHKTITATGLVLAHWRDGQIAEAWNEFDALGIFQEAGVVAPLIKAQRE